MKYTAIDQQLHVLSQPIAKVNRTFVPKQEDDSHTNLQFDAMGKRLSGRWVETPDGKIMCSLNLQTFDMEWLNDAQEVFHKTPTVGKIIVEVEQEMIPILQAFKLETKDFDRALHFKIPEYSFSKERIVKPDHDALQQWIQYRKLANDWCNAVLLYCKSSSEIRIWPHHFDTGVYTRPNENIGIGFGLAMEDQMVKCPYFYLAGYPTRNELNYDLKPELPFGQWEIGTFWKGAVLPLSILEGLIREEQDKLVESFLRPAIDWYLKPELVVEA